MKPRRLHSATILSIKFGGDFCVLAGRTMARSFPSSQAEARAIALTILSSVSRFSLQTPPSLAESARELRHPWRRYAVCCKLGRIDGAERKLDGTFRRAVATTMNSSIDQRSRCWHFEVLAKEAAATCSGKRSVAKFFMKLDSATMTAGGSSRRSFVNLAVLAGLTLVYFVAGKLGLMLAFVNASATAVWPPTGIALAALLVFGYRVWPSIFLGAFLVNITTAGSVVTSLGIATGNTLEGLLGALLVNRFANGRHALERSQDIFKFAALAAVFSTMVSATCGVTTLCLGGYARWDEYEPIWLTWWLGDAAGDFLVAPLLLLWMANPRARSRKRQAAAAAGAVAKTPGRRSRLDGGDSHSDGAGGLRVAVVHRGSPIPAPVHLRTNSHL